MRTRVFRFVIIRLIATRNPRLQMRTPGTRPTSGGPSTVQFCMEFVRPKEKQAEMLAHLLDDVVRIPGTSLRFGVDPILGLIPVVGDILTVLCGSFIVLTARRLGVPSHDLVRMMYHQLLNSVVGAIPVAGDLYSFGFKSHAKNSALLVRALKQGDHHACPILAPSLNFVDVAFVGLLTAPIALVAGLVGWWLWERDISLVSFFF